MTTGWNYLNDRRRSSLRPFLIGELLVVFLLLHVYDYVKSLETVRAAASLHNARDVLSIEKALNINIEHTANLWLAAHHTLSTALVWWYQYSHISGTMAVLTCCYLWFPAIYRNARNSLLLTNCVGLVVFVVLPVMPPRLLPHAGFIDTVAVAGFGSNHGGPITPAQFAAMPSLHLAWALWVAIVSFAMLRGMRSRVLVFIYPATTTVAVIATGNHYVLDVVAGVALAVVACTICGLTQKAREPVTRSRPEPVPIAALESS